MKQEKGENVIEAEQVIEKMVYNYVKLTVCKKIKSINHSQLLTSIINKMKTRLISEAAEEGERIQQLFKQLC